MTTQDAANPEATCTCCLAAARRRFHHPDLAMLAAEQRPLKRQVLALLTITAAGRRNLVGALQAQPNHPLKGWCVVFRLLEESAETTCRRIRRSAQLAELARRMATLLSPKRYGASHLAELTALAWAHEGNAHRAAGKLAKAGACFAEVEALLAGADAGEPGLRARTLGRLASYQLARRQLAEAEATAATARALARQAEDGIEEGFIALQQAAVACEQGHLPAALERCREALALLPADIDPMLHAEARHNLAWYLTRAGAFDLADAEVALAKPHLAFLSPNALVKARWLQGIICRGLGQGLKATAHLREARLGSVRQKRPYQAALVGLELAIVLLERGCNGAACERALASYQVFKELGIRREALATLVLVRDAAEQNALTVELLQQAREQADG